MTEQTEQMIRYITVEIMRRSDVQIDETTPLVSSGLIDSLALVDIVMKLEDVTHTRLPAGKIQAKDMDTVQLMFATAARVGKPRR
jgi:acyl carrier protein